MKKLVYKGTLCDDHMHMTATEYVAHRAKEHVEKQKMLLRKLANNPILADEYRNALDDAVYVYESRDWWMERYRKLKEKIADEKALQ